MTQRFDFFFFAETSRRSWEDQVSLGAKSISLTLPSGTPLEDALQFAMESGMPKGSSRSACFEVQTDTGIHQRKDGKGWGRLTPANSEFVTWDQLED